MKFATEIHVSIAAMIMGSFSLLVDCFLFDSLIKSAKDPDR